jgi:hypothetical protein
MKRMAGLILGLAMVARPAEAADVDATTCVPQPDCRAAYSTFTPGARSDLPGLQNKMTTPGGISTFRKMPDAKTAPDR